MKELKKHLNLYPERIRNALLAFSQWEGVCEIRLRRGFPLSLTHFRGNLFLDEKGRLCQGEQALRAKGEEIALFAARFCRGSLYRYFDGLREGYAVDEDGYRLGLCPDAMSGEHLETEFTAANLRIPRFVKGACDGLLRFFQTRPLSSTLILSPPGGGKTTLLRDLALRLSEGACSYPPMRVAVIDPRRELFPSRLALGNGLCDVVSGVEKTKGMEIALRVLGPQVLICDEIGSPEEAQALHRLGRGGCMIFASAHALSVKEALARKALFSLCDDGIFSYAALLSPRIGENYSAALSVEEIA